jgi:hypothetical protein
MSKFKKYADRRTLVNYVYRKSFITLLYSCIDELTLPVGLMNLTLILLTSTKWWAPASASKWRMGINSAFNPYPANVDKMVGSCQC